MPVGQHIDDHALANLLLQPSCHLFPWCPDPHAVDQLRTVGEQHPHSGCLVMSSK